MNPFEWVIYVLDQSADLCARIGKNNVPPYYQARIQMAIDRIHANMPPLIEEGDQAQPGALQ